MAAKDKKDTRTECYRFELEKLMFESIERKIAGALGVPAYVQSRADEARVHEAFYRRCIDDLREALQRAFEPSKLQQHECSVVVWFTDACLGHKVMVHKHTEDERELDLRLYGIKTGWDLHMNEVDWPEFRAKMEAAGVCYVLGTELVKRRKKEQ